MKEQQEKILRQLKATPNEFVSPTKIGIAIGWPYSQASSRVCSKLKRFVKDGLVERDSKGKYKITRAGLIALDRRNE